MTKKRVLIADSSPYLQDEMLLAPAASHYEIEFAKTGPECVAKLKSFDPDIVLIDIMLPVMHGIELLKKIKQNEDTRHIGVIISSFQPMIQNYRASIEAGADYFILKPFHSDAFFLLIEQFFLGELKVESFEKIHHPKIMEPNSCYNPKLKTHESYIKFWGTRGSNPVSGSRYIRFGGNTCSLEIRHKKDLIVVDAGTGIRQLGDELSEDPNIDTIHLIIGHTHWDHITGFPFFAPIYNKNVDIIIWSPVGYEKSTKELFTEMLAYAYFPVRLEEMGSKLIFKEFRDGKELKIGDVTIHAHRTNHPGSTLGFKIETEKTKIGYITDNEFLMGYLGHPNQIDSIDHPILEPYLSLIEFLKGVDSLIHEAQYTPTEYPKKIGWGHSSMSNASVLLKFIDCKHWIVTHHDPKHTDKHLRDKTQLHLDMLEECKIDSQFQMAYDGLIIPFE